MCSLEPHPSEDAAPFYGIQKISGAPFLQDDVSCVTLIVTDHQAIAVAADLNSETQTVYRYEI